jgi:preprotein translocase subunit SecD
MDLQPNRNVGLENQLQAIQLGASLYDRAQTQKRMMEQLQVQTAESLLQRQGMELQNKIRDNELASAIGEQKAQVDEYNTFSTLGKQVSDYLNNPKKDAVFPVVPAFKSKTYRLEADKMLNNLEKYSARAELLKARERAETTSNTLKASTINKAIDAGAWIGFNEDGSPNIDVPKMNAYFEKVGTSKIGQTEAKTTSLIGNLEVAKNNLIRLQQEGKDKVGIENAKMAYRKALDREKLDLEGEKVDILREKTGLEGEKVDILREKANKTVGLKPTKLDLDELEFSEAVLNGIKPLEPYLNQDLYGPTFNVRVKAGEMSGAFGTEREANQVYNNLRSGALFKRGGKALTKSEIGVITSNIGNPTDSGFPDRVNTYKLLQARTLKDRIDKLRTQGISNNPQYSGYIADLEKKANEVLGVEEEVAAPTGQGPKRVKQGGKIYELDETTNAYVEVVQ